MRSLSLLILLFISLYAQEQTMSKLYNFEVTTINGDKVLMKKYEGKVILIVNVASKCAFTSQYEGLEKLYKQYKERGLVILGFPSNQFANQEPAHEKEIQNFCRSNYDVTFDLFSKIEVNGANAEPLYRFLKKQNSGLLGSESIKWNFTKFLINKKGDVVKRFAPSSKPSRIENDIISLLQE